ncbi:MAG: SDR family oxidoreductase [Gammaproteobacteria bacterium]|nr:SDR family oxidoreductase [Gammaproteobacteria bacterium]MDE0224161.1 SDR family oxidoreductase [Gammaproteobacteria bacterium]MDE0453581.1 SDR family oxidoreductase [Gammaproteobacteria bacterium]
MRFGSKVAIVAGGARDIGRAVSEKLATEGAKVVVNYCNSEEGAQATVERIRSAGGAAVAVKGDMTVAADVANVVQAAQANYGNAIHVLVNVVGGLVARKSLLEMDEAFLEQVMRLNVTSTFLTTRAVIPYMGDGGAIVNFASQAGRDGGGAGAAAYGASKAAVMAFTRAMAKELGPANIRVNCVCPGMISTTFHDTFTNDEVRASVAAGTTLRREGQTSEVAELVAYLASPEASFINGASVDINGGTVFS